MSIFGDIYYGVRNSQAVTRFLDTEEVKEKARQSIIYTEEKNGKQYAVEVSKVELKKEYEKIEETLKEARMKAQEKGITIDDDTYEATERMLKHQCRERLIDREVAEKERRFEYAKVVANDRKVESEYYTGDISGPGKEQLWEDVKGDKSDLREFEKEQAILKNAGRDFGGGIRKINHKEYKTVNIDGFEWAAVKKKEMKSEAVKFKDSPKRDIARTRNYKEFTRTMNNTRRMSEYRNDAGHKAIEEQQKRQRAFSSKLTGFFRKCEEYVVEKSRKIGKEFCEPVKAR